MEGTRHFDVIIVGGGPAALTAAIYTSRAQLKTLVLEGGGETRDSQAGGQLMQTTEVENFPGFAHGGISGVDLILNMNAQAANFGAKILSETAEELLPNPFRNGAPFFIVKTKNKSEYSALAVIVATGASAKYLGLSAEMKFMNRGVSACATCDGALPRFRNKAVCVVGGGDTAMEEAQFLSRFASKVFIVHRRDSFRASKIMADRVMHNPKIEVVWNSVVVDIEGSDDEGVTGVHIARADNPTVHSILSVAGYFCAIGHRPNSDLVKNLIYTDHEGYIVTEKGSTLTPYTGLFAAGDVADSKYRQAITAAGSGCMAAMDVTRFLSK